MRIVAFLSDPDGQGHYRVLNPLTMLARLGHDVDVIRTRPKMTICASVFQGVDVVILQRLQGIIDLLAPLKDHVPEEQLPKVVYDIDDNLWEMPHDNPSRIIDGPAVLTKLTQEMQRAHAVTVSTPELGHEIYRRGINRSIHLLPNGIDYDLRDWETIRERPLALRRRPIIGWAGGLHHNGDEVPLGGTLATVLRKHPEWLFVMQGSSELAGLWKRRLNIPEGQFYFLEGEDFNTYQTSIGRFDIAIAPLRVNDFNKCKSELRLMEYGAQGVPYVASRIEPFTRFHHVTMGLGGFLASDEYEWRAQLEMLMQNYELRQTMSAAIRSQTRRHYDLAEIAPKYIAAFEAITGKRAERELAVR